MTADILFEKSRESQSQKYFIRAHLHMAKNLSTKSQRIVDEVSAKDFSSPAAETSSI